MSAPDRARAVAPYLAAGCAALYGAMKLAQALGSDVLADKSPLPPDLRARLLDHDPLFVASHWLFAVLSALGILIALAAVRPWGSAGIRRILIALSLSLGVVMVLRALGAVGFGFVGDALLLTGASGGGLSPPFRELVLWDLALWSPFFLVWGTSWLLTGWRAVRTPRRTPTAAELEPGSARE